MPEINLKQLPNKKRFNNLPYIYIFKPRSDNAIQAIVLCICLRCIFYMC